MSILSVISFAWTVLQSFVDPLTQQYRYVMSSGSFNDDLQKEVDDLAESVKRVEHIKEEADNNLRVVHDWVPEWLATAKEASEKARDLLGDFERATDKTCCYGTLPDPICLHQFSQEADNKIKSIKQLVEKTSTIKDMNDISFSGRAPGTVTTASSASTSFESRDLLIQKIMEALADDSHSVVGVHGMGGLGKSTLLKDAERRIREEKLFDWVTKVDVSENPDTKSIQEEIAFCLGFGDLKKEVNVSSRAQLLRERLQIEEEKKKKVLIILDNLWRGLDLKSVGIPCGHDNKVRGCKLLLTSRSQDVLRREMGCDKDFLLGELKEEEAKRLFERTVGDKVHDDPFKFLVNEALHKCAGLPFLIIAMANIFKDADYSEWKDVLRQIEMPTNKGISGSINEMLQLSYDRFTGEDGKELKSLLRLCVVYGVSKPSIENLVRYGMGSRLFQEDSSMEEVRDRLSSLIRTLKASSLLLVDNEDVNGFKIHDLVRGFVASVASRDDPLLVWKDNDKLGIELLKDKLKSCTAVCFPYVDMEELPEELDCPEMRIFLLFTNNGSLKVPNSYFNSMKKLMVLHLSRVRLTCSPSPFQLLEKLQTLCLDGCLLEDVAVIGELKWLHILSFASSNIERLPKEIGQLVELRLLDLNNCWRLKIIEPSVLQCLMKLEELYLENSFNQWNFVEQTPPTNAKLIELNNKKNLCTLHVSIPHARVLPEDLNVTNLTKYKIKIGGDMRGWRSCKGSSALELKLDPTSDILQKGCIQTLLGKTNDLFLDGLDGIEKSICSLSREGFQKLKHLQVENSPSIRYVLQSPSHTYFPMLESLLLENLINLEKICNNSISSKSFSALKVLRVGSCGKMEVLFPLSLLKELPRLEEIQAIECPLMREIVEVDDCGKVELRNLHKLELRDLSNINNFFTARNAPSSSTSEDQVDTQVAFFSGQQVSFPSLESLTMGRLPNVKEIWADESPLILSNLQSLNVSTCKSLSKVINSKSLVKLRKLHTLTVEACILVQEIFDLDGLGDDENIETELNTIYIEGLLRLRCIWSKNPCGIVRFHNLKKLLVYNCDNLKFLFFPSMVQSLEQLRELYVSSCKNMEAIIMEEEGLRVETSKTLVFSMLTNLQFGNLESLTCFSHKKCTPKAQDEDCVKSCSTVLFNQEVSIPSLESLTIARLPNLNDIWADESPLMLSNLQSLAVCSCKSLSKIINSRSLVKLHKLHTLNVSACVSVQEIFCLEERGANANIETLSELNTIYIEGLPNLRSIWNKNPCGIVRFHNLKKLKVYSCANLRFLFFPSMVQSLAQLRELYVRNCKNMEAIIMEEEGFRIETSETLVFSMLTNLQFANLERLTCFSRKKCTPKAQDEDCVKSCSTILFNQEVAFPSLETLYIDSMDNIEMIWDNQVPEESFPKLKSLSVYTCNKLVNSIPSCILGRFRSLESMKVASCGSLEFVFKFQPLNPLDRHAIAHLSLKKLELNKLPKLKCVWDKELHNQVEFQCLRSVTVSGCKSLDSLFPASVAIHLTQLEELEISECGIAELIEKEGVVPRDVFPRLTSFKLKHLTKLKCIHTGTHALHWLALKTLEVHGCNKVEILALQPKNEMPLHKQPLFLIEKGVFPNLQELRLDLSERMEIWHGHFHDGEFFYKLRVLELHNFSKESAISICHFVQSLTNLEELVVCRSYLEELSIIMEAIEGPSQEHKVFLFSRFFQHLKTLDVSCCDELSNMFTPTIAENLVELIRLRISNCKMLIEVIHDEGGEEGLVVAFNKLKYMELDGLTRLRCFSSIKYTLKFPLLGDVIVSGCPNMKCFTGGPIEAPKLERVQVSTEAWFWKGNLNSTIQNMFEEMATVAGVKFMQLSEFPEIIGKWHSELNPINLSWQLESLMVDKCSSFINAIPSKLMFVLDKVERLQVCDCESLEEIFDLEGLVGVGSTRVLPSFMTLDLLNLPKLRQLWNKDLQGSSAYNFLRYMTLHNCNNLRHAFAPSMIQCLANLRKMEIKECGQMEGVIMEEEGRGSTLEKITFPSLFWVGLEYLPNLTGFLLGKNYTLNCPNTYYLTIAHCPKMRSLTRQSLMEIDYRTPSLFTSQVQFPKLGSIVLSHMDNLIKIWTDNPQDALSFEHLWNVKVKNCKSLKNLFPHWVAISLNQLKKLQVEFCAIEEIVTSGDDTSHSITAQVLFPQLTSLEFHDMPQLKSFCSNLPTLNWPFLKELRVIHCDKLNMLSFEASMNKWTQRDNQHDLLDHEACFSFERVTPALERLLLVDKDIQMILDRRFSDDIFDKPKALTLACFHDENAVFPPIFFLQRFQNLQSLEILCSSFEDILPEEGLVDEGQHSVLENLKELKLSKLHNLKSVWREGYLVAKILQSVDKFEVRDCPNLTTLFPAVTSFQNLTELVVENSSGLAHLVTVSAIMNLVHLFRMTIRGCERMKEVVANDENGEGKVISLRKLTFLTLQNLPSLECFSSTTCIFKFPSMNWIEVEECPKMKIFSKGMISTPQLKSVRLFRYYWDGYWEGDLNTTIQKLSA